jgi:hypothetical protein
MPLPRLENNIDADHRWRVPGGNFTCELLIVLYGSNRNHSFG